MKFDFHGLCDIQTERLMRRLESLKKKSIGEYHFALDIINDAEANKRRGEISKSIEEVIFTAMTKAQVAYQECAHKVIAIMEQNL